MKRGSVYWVNLEPSDPPEFGKVRPGLILSGTEYNLQMNTVVIVPLSTKAPEIWPLRLELKLKGIPTSYLVLPGIRQVSKNRLRDSVGIVSAAILAKIDDALQAYLMS